MVRELTLTGIGRKVSERETNSNSSRMCIFLWTIDVSESLFCQWSQRRGGKMSKCRWICSSYFGGFEIWPIPIFLRWKSFEQFIWVSQNFRYFFGSENFQLFFGVLQFFYHTLESFEWKTHSIEKHKIIAAFHIVQILTNNISLSHSLS